MTNNSIFEFIEDYQKPIPGWRHYDIKDHIYYELLFEQKSNFLKKTQLIEITK